MHWDHCVCKWPTDLASHPQELAPCQELTSMERCGTALASTFLVLHRVVAGATWHQMCDCACPKELMMGRSLVSYLGWWLSLPCLNHAAGCKNRTRYIDCKEAFVLNVLFHCIYSVKKGMKRKRNLDYQYKVLKPPVSWFLQLISDSHSCNDNPSPWIVFKSNLYKAYFNKRITIYKRVRDR